jgi:hypothetical protein
MTLSSSGEIEVDFDYGDEPFPDEQLFPAEVYRADLEAYPRQVLPTWLAAYVGHGERQSRPAQLAALQARADRAAGVRGVLSQQEFPAFPLMSARWAVIAAAFIAAGSQWGPRVLPALGWFEGAKAFGIYRRFRAALPGAAGFGECLTRLFLPRTEYPRATAKDSRSADIRTARSAIIKVYSSGGQEDSTWRIIPSGRRPGRHSVIGCG